MILMVVLLSITTDFVQCSGTHHAVQDAVAPVVTAASSQYFERIFNRLVAAPPQPVFEPVIPVAPPPPVIVEATRTFVPTVPTNPPQNDPNIAIAIATAYAAAPVATILLPPYPFGFPPNIAPLPQQPETTVLPSETTTRTTTTQTTTEREQEVTTPVPSNLDNSFAQALPSNENINYKLYGPPLLPPPAKPQKLKTTVEIVPVPLTYIAPPPIALHHHHHHHHRNHHQALRVPHVHTFLPKTRILIRPISSPLRVRTAALILRPSPNFSRRSFVFQPQILRPRSRDAEPTTIKPY